ncbi:DNA polymerase III subunit epsilon [compost metagenome]
MHGALLDSEILAEVYLELLGGKQVSLALMAETNVSPRDAMASRPIAAQRPTPLPSRISAEEMAGHERMLASLGADSVWAHYSQQTEAAE